MGSYKEVEGDLIKLAKEGNFDVIAHGVNCFCNMGAGIAPQMAKAFRCDRFPLEAPEYRGDHTKLGLIDFEERMTPWEKPLVANASPTYTEKYLGSYKRLTVVNAYTQYGYGRNHKHGSAQPLDYEALESCFIKINSIFAGQKVGLPQIGCGLAGGDWNVVKEMIQTLLVDCDVTVVIFNG